MKLKAYFLVASVLLLGIAADTKDAKPVEGVNPGDFAPRIVLDGNESEIHFQNPDGRFTLVNFWAAYNAESRAKNVSLWNEVKKLNGSSGKVSMYSISLDEWNSVFEETVKADKLDMTRQLHEKKGSQSDVFKKYRLERGLRNFLIDDKGIIVATNVSSKALAEWEKRI